MKPVAPIRRILDKPYQFMPLEMPVIHISETDAVNDFASVLARVRAGAEVIMESDKYPVAVLRAAIEQPVRLLSESLRFAREHGSTAILDGAFGRDLEEIVSSHPEPLHPPSWD
jgi:antitoxin (DNA-binding transcriptional repressor) of toxin-antitoxin stability system